MAKPDVATSEIGSSAGISMTGTQITPYEDNPELVWPRSVQVYDRMRTTDGQISSILRAIRLLISGTQWKILGSEVNPKILDFVEAEIGLQADQDGRLRRPDSGFDFHDHLRLALLSGPIGHSYFEQVYSIDDDHLDPHTGLPITAHLSRLAWRPHRSIMEFVTEPNGDLAGIRQYVEQRVDNISRFGERFIAAKYLVPYVTDREGADWAGSSWLRACWFDWTTKVKMGVFDAIGVERNSSGIVKVTYDESLGNITKADALAQGRKIRSGEESTVAVPVGSDVEMMGMTGSRVDPLPSIKYRDEMIGRTLLAMILNLGHDSGSYALGQTMYDLFCSSMNAIATDLAATFTEKVIRPLVALNFGEDEAFPALVPEEITPEATLTPEQLKSLVDAGVITPDADLEADRRRRYKLPPQEVVAEATGTQDLAPVTELAQIKPMVQAASRGDLDRARVRAEIILSNIRAQQGAPVGNDRA
jgi:hypothetical protein